VFFCCSSFASFFFCEGMMPFMRCNKINWQSEQTIYCNKKASKQASKQSITILCFDFVLLFFSLLYFSFLRILLCSCFCCIASCLLLTHPLNHDKRTQTDFLHLYALCVIHLLGLPAGEDNFFLVCM
jgi:hypothetical protein